ncbi:MAG: hybrid sensor histidine kinase/response regulator [Ktedonobacterales bacterium]
MSGNDQVNVLMVDDQPGKLLSYETILADLDVNLIKASSPREALDCLLKNKIAIVLMDVVMPEMDGFELAAMIRDHPRYQQTAIVFVSAERLTDLDRLKGYEMGAVDYIPVPVIPDILRAKVSVLAELFRKTRQLEGMNVELERRVEERTAELEAALQVRDDFLSVAAHELKTPLTGLRATAQILARRAQKSELNAPDWFSDGLRTLDQQADRLTRLIAQLLDVSRLEHGKLRVEYKAVDLTALTEKLITTFKARTNKHTLTLSADPALVAEVDPVGAEQILSNLLDNAIKYSPDGGHIEIEVRRTDDGYARLMVRDHGIGIPVEKREAIFGRFYQAHTEDHRSGLGLGLYISHQIIEQHDGKITAEFPDDGGTRFVVSLPLSARDWPAASAQVKAARPKVTAPPAGRM